MIELNSPRYSRRAFGQRLLVLVLATVAMAPFASAQAMFRGDAAHSGLGAGEGPKALKGVKWSAKTGGPITSSPVIAGGVLYIGSDDKALHALDLATGAEKWKFDTGGAVRSTPAVTAGVAYFGSYDGNFYAVDAASGAAKWKFETGGERKFAAKGLHGSKPRAQIIPDAWDCWLSSPVVVGERVFVGSGDGNVYALNTADGKLAWKFATGDVVHSSPAVVDGVLYVGSFDRFFYALDAGTGELKWKLETGADAENHNQEGIPSSPCVADGVVYFGCRDFHLYAVKAQDGAVKWKHKITWIIATPTVRDGVVYASTSIPPMVFGCDVKTGEEVLKVELKAPVFSSPTLAGGLAYAGSFDGKLTAVDLAAKKVAWVFQTEAAKENARHALTPEGELNYKALFPSDSFETMFAAVDALFSIGAITSSPAVADGVVYVGSADGKVYALE